MTATGRSLAIILALLFAATLGSFASWSEIRVGQWAFVVTMVLAAVKGHLICAWFMDLRSVSRIWLRLLDGLLLAAMLGISGLHLAAMPTLGGP